MALLRVKCIRCNVPLVVATYTGCCQACVSAIAYGELSPRLRAIPTYQRFRAVDAPAKDPRPHREIPEQARYISRSVTIPCTHVDEPYVSLWRSPPPPPPGWFDQMTERARARRQKLLVEEAAFRISGVLMHEDDVKTAVARREADRKEAFRLRKEEIVREREALAERKRLRQERKRLRAIKRKGPDSDGFPVAYPHDTPELLLYLVGAHDWFRQRCSIPEHMSAAFYDDMEKYCQYADYMVAETSQSTIVITPIDVRLNQEGCNLVAKWRAAKGLQAT